MTHIKLDKKLVGIFLISLAAVACTKENDNRVTRIQVNKQVAYLKHVGLDIDRNGTTDFIFHTSLLTGGDYTIMQFDVASMGSNAIWYNSSLAEITPLQKGDSVFANPVAAASWDGLDNYLWEERYDSYMNKSWRGAWATSGIQYLGVKIPKGSETLVGWIALSADTANQRMKIHNAAYTTDPFIRAGY